MSDQTAGGLLLPRCQFCHQVPELGIKGGYKLIRGFICLDCEAALIRTNPESLRYLEFVNKIKAILK